MGAGFFLVKLEKREATESPTRLGTVDHFRVERSAPNRASTQSKESVVQKTVAQRKNNQGFSLVE